MIPAGVSAQASPATSNKAVVQQFVNYADHFGGWLVEAFDSIPAARYDYRPTAIQQSFGYIAQHVEDANYALCERITSMKHLRTAKDSLADTIKAKWPKDTLVARLRASLRYCDAAMEGLTDITPASANRLIAFETDLAEHYSQVANYMRLVGLVPPSALPQKPRVAISLPPSELAKLVGSYELAPGSLIVIERGADGLTIRATASGGGAARLWPESTSEFFVKEVDAQVTIDRDASGAVTGLVLHQFNRDRPAKKLP